MIDIQKIDAPEDIKKSLGEVSKNIQITKDSSKGGNGYLFFGDHNILDRGVAIKYYYWGGQKKHHAEPNQLSQVKSDNIIDIYAANHAGDEWAYFVTPYCASGDLDDLIEAQSIVKTNDAIGLTLGVLNGLCSLHSADLVHRDLKPANIFAADSGAALIGDFGSLKKLPEQAKMVTGSGHSFLYRPPESLDTNLYGVQGDLYQVGILLYQLLGGYLPYEEISWLNKKDRKRYSNETDHFERQKIVDEVLKRKVTSGRLLDMQSLPIHVEEKLKRVIRRATKVSLDSRYKSASEFMADLKKARDDSISWEFLDGFWSTVGTQSYRCREIKSQIIVEKKINAGWRKDGGFKTGNLDDAYVYIRSQ